MTRLFVIVRLAARDLRHRPGEAGLLAIVIVAATTALALGLVLHGTANPGPLDVGFISQAARENQVLLIVSVMLVALAAVNAIFIAWAAVQDSRHTAAVTRALGATPGQLTVGLSAAQVFPAILGALLGIAGGYGLFAVASQGGSVSQPPAWWLVTALLGTVVAIAALTSIPARVGARLSVVKTLQANGT